jgi:hypothetical protein
VHRVRKTELIDVIGSFPKESDTCLEPGGAASANGSYAALGVRSKFNDGRRHAFALWWDKEKEKVYAPVWTEFQNRDKAQKAVKCRRAVDSGIEVDISDGCAVWMRLEVPSDDAHDHWKYLRQCIRTWCVAWKNVPAAQLQGLTVVNG